MKGLKYYWIKEYDVKYYFIEKDLLNGIKGELDSYFLELYSILDEPDKNRIKNILVDKLNISEYLNINKIKEDFKSLNPDFNISQEIYKFISLFDFLREKIINKNFLENLENNYGVCLESEKYIEEIKNKTLDDIYIKNILKKYDLFSIEELYLLNYFNQKGYYLTENMFCKSYRRKKIFPKLYLFMIPEKICYVLGKIYSKLKNLKHFKVNKEKKKIKYKEKLERSNFNIKISYDKINNKRFTKYMNKKNINRLLLFKRNHY